MTIQEIRIAVNKGHTVHWKSSIYKVVCDMGDDWNILCTVNNHRVGLTYKDSDDMTNDPDDFYIS